MIIGMLLAAHIVAAPIDFRQAKARADANEASLAPALHAQLLEAQGRALKTAVATCRQPNPDLYRFTVVLSLNADGSVASSWLQGRTSLARCVRGQLAGSGLPGHWPTPFYTSFEVSFDGH
jgi:hypothetical protein